MDYFLCQMSFSVLSHQRTALRQMVLNCLCLNAARYTDPEVPSSCQAVLPVIQVMQETLLKKPRHKNDHLTSSS